MSTSTQLFDLIKSLDSSEKRYVSTHTLGTKKESNYRLLFDAIEKQTVYNEKELKHKFRTFTFTKQFNVTRQNLYRLLLKSLRDYHSESLIDGKIRNHIANAEILFYKGLFDSCEKEVIKGKDLSRTYERYEVLPELLKWERVLITKTKTSLNTNEDIERAFNENKEALLTNLQIMNTSFHAKRFQFNSIHPDIINPTKNVLPKLKQIIEKDFNYKPDKNTPFPIARFYYMVHSKYNKLSGDNRKAYEQSKELLELIKSKPNIISDNNDEYAIYLSNHLIDCVDVGELEDFDNTYKEIQELKVRYAIGRAMKVKANGIKMDHCHERDEIEEGIKASVELERNLGKTIEMYQGAYTGYFLIAALFYLYRNDFSNAIKWNNKTLTAYTAGTSGRKDFYLTGRIIEVLIHFKKDDLDFCTSLTKSLERHFIGEDIYFEGERKLIDCFKHMIKYDKQKDWGKIYCQLVDNLESTINNGEKSMYFRHFDFVKILRGLIN